MRRLHALSRRTGARATGPALGVGVVVWPPLTYQDYRPRASALLLPASPCSMREEAPETGMPALPVPSFRKVNDASKNLQFTPMVSVRLVA